MFLYSAYCNGDIKCTNNIRDMLNSFTKGQVPKSWKSEYVVGKTISASQYIFDLANRIKHLEKYVYLVSNSGESSRRSLQMQGAFWLGGLFYPEAFITATRQLVAQVLSYMCIHIHVHVYLYV